MRKVIALTLILAILGAQVNAVAPTGARTTTAAGVVCTSDSSPSTGCSACAATTFVCTAATGYYQTATTTTPAACLPSCATCTTGTTCTACYGLDTYADAATTIGGTGTVDCSVCDSTVAVYDSADSTNRACVPKTAGFCFAGYTDVAAGTAQGTDLTGDCKYCVVATHYSNSNAEDHICFAQASTTVDCATGYSDLAPVSGANTAPTASGTARTGDCKYCADTAFATSNAEFPMCKTITPNTNSCDAAYSDVAPVSGVNSAATASGTDTTGNCVYCAPNYFSDGAATNNACIDSSANTADCTTGYWYNAGYAADTTACINAAANCATGYAEDTAAADTKNCAICASGYSFDATNTTQCVADAPADAANGKLLATSIAVIASIIMIVF